MYSTLNTGIVKKGTEVINGSTQDLTGWKIVLIKDEQPDGGVYINIEERIGDGKYKYLFNNWVEQESDTPKFFAEKEWEMEWEK